MSKYDIGVGEDFPLEDRPLDEPQQDCGDRHGRWRHHNPHHRHHDHSHDHHHRFHMAALAMLFALKAYRRHMRRPGETL